MEGNLRFKIDWASLIVGSKFIVHCIRGQFSKYKPPGGLYLEERFKGGSFALPFKGGLYMVGSIFGILRYLISLAAHAIHG